MSHFFITLNSNFQTMVVNTLLALSFLITRQLEATISCKTYTSDFCCLSKATFDLEQLLLSTSNLSVYTGNCCFVERATRRTSDVGPTIACKSCLCKLALKKKVDVVWFLDFPKAFQKSGIDQPFSWFWLKLGQWKCEYNENQPTS